MPTTTVYGRNMVLFLLVGLEGLSANLAFEIRHVGMLGRYVLLIVSTAGEALAAVLARVAVTTLVQVHVVHKSGHRLHTLVTDTTGKFVCILFRVLLL